MKATEARENTTWIGSVALGCSTRRVSRALVPSAMPAYWLPDAASRPEDAAQVSPSSWRPMRSGSSISTIVQTAATQASATASTAVARTLPSAPRTRCSSGGPKAVAELNRTFIGPKRVVAPRRAPTASGAANRPRPTTASWLVALPTPNSTTKRCPRCPRRTNFRTSSGAPVIRGRSSAAAASSAGSAESPHTATSRCGPAPCGCTASAGTATSSRRVSPARA